jgi:probable F420-dependent oxidoreductase
MLVNQCTGEHTSAAFPSRGDKKMQRGVVFPHTELAPDTSELRTFVQAVEQAGFDYLAIPEHILGADSSTRPDWKGPYDTAHAWRELFVVLGYMAGFTSLELVPSILVLPQRQTALVAKQAAEVDLLSGGRLRLGVAAGWNIPEFEALGASFADRGARMDEQIEVLRKLWTQEVVTFAGRFHTLDRVGLRPLPVQRPIPIWIGGAVKRFPGLDRRNPSRVIHRVAALGDGWISSSNDPLEHIVDSYQEIRERARELGRDPAQIGLQTSLAVPRGHAPADVLTRWAELAEAGSTHVTIETRNAGRTLAEHVTAITEIGQLTA